ncbi:MAG: FG-GAP repeat domain-containing protein [Acidiferrobacterales bacterium]
MFKVVKYIVIGVTVLVAVIVTLMAGRAINDRKIDYDVDLMGTIIPEFREVFIPFTNTNDGEASLPFLASAIIDVEGDGREELFLGGGHGQNDGLFRFEEKEFQPFDDTLTFEKPVDDATFGAVVLDVNNDGTQDLIVARESGVWIHENKGGRFTNRKLDLEMRDDTVPLSVAVADLNGDGHFDMYVSGYIRNDLVEGLNLFREGYGGSSELYINRGDNTFENKTAEWGLTYKHNTFQSVFIDVDQDGQIDLVVAHDTGQVRTWKNTGQKFELIENPNSNFYSYPMGIAVADYDNNGLVDFFFSNVGTTPPHFLVKGDLREDQQHNWKWLLFQNQGDFKFVDKADEAKLANYEFGWGNVFEDLNLDGRPDLVVSQNFVSFPLHKLQKLRLPGRLLVQNPNGEFAEVGKQAGVSNPFFSIAPLTADFNGDGYPDIVHANLAGPSKAFLSKGGGSSYLKISLSDSVESIGAMVTITRDDGKILYLPYVSGEGLCSDSSRILIAGLGGGKAVKVSVRFMSGRVIEREGSFRNEMLKL